MVDPPSPIERKTIDDMTIDQLDAAIAQRRQRRLVAFQVYQEAVESKKRATDERLRAQLEKQIEMLVKEFARVDKMLDQVDARITKIAGVRLELEDYV